MNLFSDLEGLSGKQLATAARRHITLQSPACRAAVLDARSPARPLLSTAHFSCYTEYATSDEVHGRKPRVAQILIELRLAL